jgi:hypothetical protein
MRSAKNPALRRASIANQSRDRRIMDCLKSGVPRECTPHNAQSFPRSLNFVRFDDVVGACGVWVQ